MVVALLLPPSKQRKAKPMVNVLILDDSKEDRFFIRRALGKVVDATQVEFSYAEEALAYLRTPERPSLDVILVDISMPRMDGFEFADQFVDLYPELRGSAPLYIVSSSIDPQDVERAKAHPGVSGLFSKPLSGDAVKEIVSRAK